MSTLRLHLWKEWREQRLALLAVGLICPALMVLVWFFAPRSFLGDPLFTSVSTLVAILIVLLAVGGELLSERRAGGLAWLQRLPAGLGVSFWAKLAFHIPVTAAAGLFGIGLSFVAAWTRGVAPAAIDNRFGYSALFLGALFALWTFAASSWSSRSVIALFTAGFVLTGLGAPIWYLTLGGYRLQSWELVAGSALLLIGSLPSAWLGFVTAGRFGRGPGFGGALGFAAAVASFLPFWGWGPWQIHQRDRFDPSMEGFEIDGSVVTDDGQTAFVEASIANRHWEENSLPHSILRVNLDDGRFERIQSGEVRMIAVHAWTDDCQRADSVQIRNREGSKTGEAFDLSVGAPAGLGDVFPKTPYRCPERRGWLKAWAPFRSDTVLTDAFTGKSVYPAELELPREARMSGACLYSDLGRWYVTTPGRGVFAVDPDSKTVTRAAGLEDVEDFGPRLPDGRFFVSLRSGGVGLVDPVRGVVARLDGADGSDEFVQRACAFGGSDRPFEEGELVLLRTSVTTYRFDPIAESLEPVPFLNWPRRPIRSSPDGSVLVDIGTALVRYDIDTGAMTALFPRPKSGAVTTFLPRLGRSRSEAAPGSSK